MDTPTDAQNIANSIGNTIYGGAVKNSLVNAKAILTNGRPATPAYGNRPAVSAISGADITTAAGPVLTAQVDLLLAALSQEDTGKLAAALAALA